ncbi:MAG: DUF177 domain-containing protein [Bacteroidota bacterium]
MNPLVEYTIPIKGLSNGIYQFEYQIDRNFLTHFEQSPVSQANIQMQVDLEKKPGLFVLQFNFSGTIETDCDRCLAAINLPVSGENRLLVKYSEEAESDDPEVVYIHPEATKLELADFIYEFLILSIPMIKVYDCEAVEEANIPCDYDMLDRLSEPSDDADETENTNPAWEELKKFNAKK